VADKLPGAGTYKDDYLKQDSNQGKQGKYRGTNIPTDHTMMPRLEVFAKSFIGC
jgi:hypothetical protein